MTVYWFNTKYICLNFKHFGPHQTPINILDLTKCEQEQELRDTNSGALKSQIFSYSDLIPMTKKFTKQ